MSFPVRRKTEDERQSVRLWSFVIHHSSLAWSLILAAAILVVYASSLAYPFFWVDPIDIGLAGSRSISTILTTSQGYLYYRPFAFILWKLLYALSGRFDPFTFHLVHVATHLANAWLMFALAKRLFKKPVVAGIAALFFAWYPFSYQTVTWVISPQVQATGFVLGSAILYYDGRMQRQRKKIWLSLLLLAMALPFHENAVSFGFVIAALEIYLRVEFNHEDTQPLSKLGTLVPHLPAPSSKMENRAPSHDDGVNGIQPGGNRVRPSRWPLAHIGLCLAFAAVWFIIPKEPDSAVARFEPAAGWYLLQGLIWPVAGAVGQWRIWFPSLSNPAWQPLIVTAPITLLFLATVYARARRLALLALGLVWYAVMVLPIWATRGIGYVGVSSRVLYVAAGGAVLVWAGLLTIDFRSIVVNRFWKAASIVLAGLIVVQSATFSNVRKVLQDNAMPAIWDVVDSGAAAGSNARLLYVNVPDQITPYLREYPVGFFRAVLMPVSVDLGQYAELQTGFQPHTEPLTGPIRAPLENYPSQFDMRGPAVNQTQLDTAIRSSGEVFITEYRPDGRIHVVEAGHVRPGTALNRVALFDSRLELVSASTDSKADRVVLTLTWDCLGEFDPQETIFIHALDASGRLAAQADGDPLQNLYPLSQCQPGEQIVDIHYLTLPTGAYTLKVGVYNRSTNERLAAIDAEGNSIADSAFTIGQVTQ